MFETGANFDHGLFLSNLLKKAPHLLVGRRQDTRSFLLAELIGELLEPYILVDSHHRRAYAMGVEFAQKLLKFRTERPVAVIGRVGNTGDLSKLLDPLL